MGESKRKRQAEAARQMGDVSQGRELVPFLSLEDRAASIRAAIDAADSAAAEAIDHSIRAGQELLAVRALVPQGEWTQWCKANIGHSRQHIARLIRIASAPNPRAALEAERSETRERVRKIRSADVTYVRSTTEPAPVVDVVSAAPALMIDIGTPSAPNDGMEAAAEWLLENMPDGINDTLRGVLAPFSGQPLARLLDALKVLDFEPLPLVQGAFTPAPDELALAA
jgi:hypothetical protein